VFLDDLAPGDLSAALGVPVIAVEPTPSALIRALIGERDHARRNRIADPRR
jgi:hypothetical protein